LIGEIRAELGSVARLLPLPQPQSAKKNEMKRRIAGQKENFDWGMLFSRVRLLVETGTSLP
jgi:hypothetical protein